ncbi:F-box domain [Arabidopsis thaliana x Arabidopsis arenosa]|uniref:F-box domain n=1 Tax=Arabidopsis thaliana x Arabidopsis arenosa TaxID=1240361 RepID=A0A8T1ZTY1_9BRAS|nr:F-box domain [Arabidopsis thaliana x Arabidopsis arenosa]
MEDLIRQLPNELLHEILLNLPTREFLNLHKESPINQFTFKCPDDVDIPCLTLLLDKVLTRGIQLFGINGSMYNLAGLGIVELPLSFYTCETLNLRLEYVMLNNFDACESFYLPHLEVMHLGSLWIPSDVVLEMLISCSPVLKVLSIHDFGVELLKVRSQTFRSLSLLRIFILKGEYDDDSLDDDGESRLVIDTPSLEFLHIRDYPLEYFRVASVRFSEVTDLSISGNTLDGTYAYSKLQQLPEIKNLTQMLPIYLSSCPNLKSIDLELHGYNPKMAEMITNSPVPQCLQTSILRMSKSK